MFVGGGPLEPAGGDRLEVLDPATAEPFEEVPAGTPAEVDAAVAAAGDAFEGWWATPAARRGGLLGQATEHVREHTEELAASLTREQGKPLREARLEIERCLETLEHYAGLAKNLRGGYVPNLDEGAYGVVLRRPLGVVGAIVPWNFPTTLLANKLGPALVACNTVVAKPAETTPLTTLRLAELLPEGGLPAGTFNVVTGTGPVAGDALVRHPKVRKVAFTGSTPVGRRTMAAAEHLKRVTLELGGSDPMIICDDADLDRAVSAASVGTILDANLEAGRGAKAAIVGEYGEVSYERLLAMACAAGRALKALGVQREQRVLMVMDDTPAFPAVFLGAIRAGMVPVPLNPLFKPEDYRYLLADSEARAVVVDLDLLPKVREALAGHTEPVPLVVAGGQAEGAHTLEDLLAEHAGELAPAGTHRDDAAFWLYSSGSTGRPKGVVHLQHDLPYTCQTYAAQVLGIGEGDRCLSTTKLFHAYGLGNSLSFPVWVGATSVQLYGRPTPDRALDAVERHRPTLLFSVPTLYNATLVTPEAKQRDLSSVRLCVSAAESLPAEIWRRWHDTYDLVILDGIGSTEMLHIFCSNTEERLRPGSSGVAVPGYDLKLLGDTDEPVAQGETGTLYVRGDSALAGNWRQHEKTKRTVLGDWVWTGDRYRQDADGFWWHQGRVDDMLKVGGLWVSPVEMEQALAEHPAVYECAVVQVLVDGLTRIKAVVVAREADAGRLTPELRDWCKQRLQRHEFPHIVEYADELPKTTTGKIQRYKLRDAPVGTTGP